MASCIDTAFPLRDVRVHEVCGPGAVSFAAISAAQMRNVLLVHETWRGNTFNPPGLSDFLDPKRLLVAQTNDQSESLAVAEEALRDGSVPLVIVEIARPLDLREGRRLQLAAKTGETTGLCIIPEGMGSNAAETRWHCTPIFDPADSTLQRWELIKNKSGTLGTWNVRWDREARRIVVVPEAGKRPGSEGAPG